MATETSGYVYCFSNPWMPALLKIGLTGRNLRERLREANGETYSPPFWKIEFAKLVENCEEAERKVHRALETYSQRLTPKREFFTCTLAQARTLFELLSGEWYVETPVGPLLLPPGIDSVDGEAPEQADTNTAADKKDNNMRQYIPDGLIIHHNITINQDFDTWTAKYDYQQDCIIHESGNQPYKSLSAFANAHLKVIYPEKPPKRSGWSECYTIIDSKRKYLSDLPIITNTTS